MDLRMKKTIWLVALAVGMVSCSKNESAPSASETAQKASNPSTGAQPNNPAPTPAPTPAVEAPKTVDANPSKASPSPEAPKSPTSPTVAKSPEAATAQNLLQSAQSLATDTRSPNSALPANLGAALSRDQMVDGLKEALVKGVEKAVTSLGKQDGFLKDAGVKIPMPESLQKVEKSLRALKQDKIADEFVTTMNRAAEQAVPEAAAVIGDSIKQMSIADAKAILTGTNNAATEYFRRTSEAALQTRLLPIVKSATTKAGVTAAYKRMTEVASSGLGNLGGLGSRLLGQEVPDLDTYVTHKALDGLFVKIAEQEQRIRENPVARTTDLLQKVFGSFGK